VAAAYVQKHAGAAQIADLAASAVKMCGGGTDFAAQVAASKAALTVKARGGPITEQDKQAMLGAAMTLARGACDLEFVVSIDPSSQDEPQPSQHKDSEDTTATGAHLSAAAAETKSIVVATPSAGGSSNAEASELANADALHADGLMQHPLHNPHTLRSIVSPVNPNSHRKAKQRARTWHYLRVAFVLSRVFVLSRAFLYFFFVVLDHDKQILVLA
jgi:hypothetical protein